MATAHRLIGVMVFVLCISGCGGKPPCQVLEEFMDKADGIIESSTGADMEKRILDLLAEYDKELQKVDNDVMRSAKEYINRKRQFKVLTTESDPTISAYMEKTYKHQKTAAISSIAKMRTDTIEKCRKAK